MSLVLAVGATACGLSVVGAQPDLEAAAGDGGDAATTHTGTSDGSTTVPVSEDAGADGAADAAAGTALRFDGKGSYVRASRPVKDDFTLEAWIRTSTSRTGIAFYEASPILWADTFGLNNDFAMGVLNGQLSFGAKSATVTSSAMVANGAWVHVAVVRSKTSMKLYVNGVADNTSNAAPTGPLDSSDTLDIGGDLVDGHFFEGDIDEVRVWNVARAPADLAATMSSRLAGTEAGLVAYWRFDDGAGTTATDSTTTHDDGALDAADSGVLPAWIPSSAF